MKFDLCPDVCFKIDMIPMLHSWSLPSPIPPFPGLHISELHTTYLVRTTVQNQNYPQSLNTAGPNQP